MAPLFPPRSATLVWTLTTPHEDIQCFVWRHRREWRVGVYFGGETMNLVTLPRAESVQLWAEAVRRELMDVGFGEDGRLGRKVAGSAPDADLRKSASPAGMRESPRKRSSAKSSAK